MVLIGGSELATPDIFLSYSREDAVRARQFADAFEEVGFKVWWDANLRSGEAYDEVTENALREAKAVVVLWSSRSVASRWVRSEATVASQNDTLFPAMIEPCRRPIMFELVQTVDLSHWSGRTDDIVWRDFVTHLEDALQKPATTFLKQPAQSTGHQAKESILVLPFVNMSGDPEQEYFSDGVTEEIITDLSKLSALSVISRHTAFALKGSNEELRPIAQRAGARFVLEGSVRRAGLRVRIATQLTDAENGHHVWAESYDRELTDIFEIQEDISKAIVASLRLKILPDERLVIESHDTDDLEAYEQYLMARQFWISGNDGDSRRDAIVLRLCQNAVDIDPTYAQAWTLIALTQSLMKFRDNHLEEDGVEAARRSLALNPKQAEPHCVLAAALARDGYYPEASRELEIAQTLDPESWEVHREAGYVHYNFGESEKALAHFFKASEIMESDFRSAGFVSEIYETLGNSEEARFFAERALESAKKAIAIDPSNSSALAWGAAQLGQLGQRDSAIDWARRALLLDPSNLIVRYNIACLYAADLEQPEKALELLKAWFEAATKSELRHIINDGSLASLVGLPEFNQMMEVAEKRIASSQSQ